MPNILWLGDPSAENLSLVGGKGANLSRLASAFRVWHVPIANSQFANRNSQIANEIKVLGSQGAM